MSGQGGVDAGQRHPFMSKSRFDRLSQSDKKSLARDQSRKRGSIFVRYGQVGKQYLSLYPHYLLACLPFLRWETTATAAAAAATAAATPAITSK